VSAGLDLLFEGAEKLVNVIAEEVSKKTGLSKKASFELVHAATEKYVESERQAITAARAKAKAKAAAARKR
jgi:hypothetical protein